MAADNAWRLISKIVRDQDLIPVLERGISEDWFPVEEHRLVFGFIKKYYSKYGKVPTSVTVLDNFPTVRLLKVEDPIDYLIDQMVDWRRRQAVIELVKEAADHIEDSADHEEAIRVLASGVTRIESDTSIKSRDVDLSADPMKRWDEYEERAARGSALLGVPSGFPTIDEATAGFQGGQLITIIATPKTGKSTLGLQVAKNVHEFGEVPFFQSFEMSNTEQQYRYDAMRAGINHQHLMRGKLDKTEQRKFKTALEEMKGKHQFILSDAAEGLTVSAVQAKLIKYAPSIAFIDGVYLMQDEVTGERGTPQALTNITRDLKRVAQKLDLPVVITTQVLLWKMRGTRVRADSIGYSSSFYQDSDVILGLEKPDEDDDTARILRIVDSRNCGPLEIDLIWDWEHARFEEMTAGV